MARQSAQHTRPDRDRSRSMAGFLHLPPVESDYPLLKHESEAIARQASVVRGWIVAFGWRL